VGVPKINPVTEQIEPYYPTSERYKRYLESMVVCFLLLMVIFVYLVAMYNITGVITAEGKFHSIFYIEWLADFAKEGAIFDAQTNWVLIPTIAQTVITMILNSMFRSFAKQLTERENHKYQSDFDDSLIIKRFSFEFYDCFLPLIYFGWWELNFKMLRDSVISLYIVDELRRVAVESLLPYITQNHQKVKNAIRLSITKKSIETKKSDDKESQKKLAILEEMEELDKDEMEIFDDYLEMIVTFGYLAMFASVFALGATIIFVFILIETRSDIFKLEKNLKRPIPLKSHTMGSWSVVLELFCFLSIFSNIIVSCYASDQMDHLLPWLKEYRESDETSVATVFALEHILLFSVFGLKLALDKDPEWIIIYMSRRAHKAQTEKLMKMKT
jgi:anoctamin-10